MFSTWPKNINHNITFLAFLGDDFAWQTLVLIAFLQSQLPGHGLGHLVTLWPLPFVILAHCNTTQFISCYYVPQHILLRCVTTYDPILHHNTFHSLLAFHQGQLAGHSLVTLWPVPLVILAHWNTTQFVTCCYTPQLLYVITYNPILHYNAFYLSPFIRVSLLVIV